MTFSVRRRTNHYSCLPRVCVLGCSRCLLVTLAACCFWAQVRYIRLQRPGTQYSPFFWAGSYKTIYFMWFCNILGSRIAPRRLPGGLRRGSWAALGPLLATLGRSWRLLGHSLAALGASWALLAALGRLLGRSWRLLGPSWGLSSRS